MATDYFEWGGNNANGTAGFESHRQGWGNVSVHQLMIDNDVSAYFHGHDHQFVHEEIDGIVYQLVPSPGMSGFGFDLYDSSPYVISGGNLADPGHLRVTVSGVETLVEYVQMVEGGGAGNGDVAYSYTIEPAEPASSITLTTPNGGETWQAGSVQNITWTSTGITENVHIEFSTNNGSSWSNVIANTTNNGSYSWVLPNAPSVNSLVRISGISGIPADQSNAVFTILPITYTLTAGSSGNGSVSLNPTSGLYEEGTTVTLIPTPVVGYQFSSWTGANAADVVNNDGVYTIIMNGNKTVTANFTQIMYTLTAGSGGNGIVSLTPAGGTYASGTTVTLTPSPVSGYQFNSWTGTNAADVVNNAGVFTIVMNGNKSITAVFTQIMYTLTASIDGFGTVMLTPSGGNYASGSIVTLTPVANTGYQFSSWTGANGADVAENEGVYTILMNGNKSVIANFSSDYHYITYSIRWR